MPALAALCLLLTAQSAPALRYELTYTTGTPGSVQVEILLPAAVGATTLVMPRAIPMGYADVPYDRYVRDVEAFGADGGALEVKRAEEGPRWLLGDGSTAVRSARYRVDLEAMEREVLGASDASKARAGYVGLLGYSVFAYPEGLEKVPIRLTVRAPDDWPLFLTLDPRSPPARGTVEAEARDFYELADSQVAMGPDLQVLRLEAPVPLFVVQYAERASDVFSRGGMMAYEMDGTIRAATAGRKSLRDLFRRLLEESPHEPLDLDCLPDLCRQSTGVDVSAIYRRWLGPQR